MNDKKRCRGLRYVLTKGVYWVMVYDDDDVLVASFTVDKKGNLDAFTFLTLKIRGKAVQI
jgi:hypothetical protein